MPSSISEFNFGPRNDHPDLLLFCSEPQYNHTSRFVLSRMVNYLNSLAENNPGHIAKHIRITLDSRQVNRMSTSQLQAYTTIECTLPSSGYCANPHVHLLDASQDERENAFLFGLSAIIDSADTPPSLVTGSARHAHSGEWYRVVLGAHHQLNLAYASQLFRGLIQFLSHLEYLERQPSEELESDTHLLDGAGWFELAAGQTGYFIHNPESTLSWLQRGDLIGNIYDASSGQHLQQICSPVQGYLTLNSTRPLVTSEDIIAVIAAA